MNQPLYLTDKPPISLVSNSSYNICFNILEVKLCNSKPQALVAEQSEMIFLKCMKPWQQIAAGQEGTFSNYRSARLLEELLWAQSVRCKQSSGTLKAGGLRHKNHTQPLYAASQSTLCTYIQTIPIV